MTIDPNNVLMVLPKFIILKNGEYVNNINVEIKEVKESCARCGKNKADDDTFFGPVCSGCKHATRHDGEKDFCMCQGSTMFRLVEWERHIADDDKGTLFLFLLNRHDMIYEDVPQSVWLKFIAAKSMGKFYNSDIKGVYLQRLDETANQNAVLV